MAMLLALEMFRVVTQRCLVVFVDAWKRQILVLLPKTGKPSGDSSTRVITSEGVIFNRQSKFTEGTGG